MNAEHVAGLIAAFVGFVVGLLVELPAGPAASLGVCVGALLTYVLEDAAPPPSGLDGPPEGVDQ